MTVENQDREYVATTLRNIFTWAWTGLKAVRFKLPLPSSNGHTDDKRFVTCVLNEDDLEDIFQRLRRGVNRGCQDLNEPILFDKISDLPDPESEFDRQLFALQARILDSARDESNIKTLRQIIGGITDIQDSRKKRTPIRKVDLQLATALARHFDPTVTEDKVIDILQYEKERLGS